MTDPEIFDRILQSCSFRFRSVVCPNRDKLAYITAVKFQADEEEWTVEECSLLPNGKVNCAMSCLLGNVDPTE
jgi:hypothetical protein